MSESTSVVNPLSTLTVADVIAPSTFGSDVIGKALAKKQAAALEKLEGFTVGVLTSAQNRSTALARAKKNLEDELASVHKEIDRINVAAAHAQSTQNIFCLAAAVGAKQSAIQFAQCAGLLVPTNDDLIWSVPAPKAE
ncbi:MAG TPA: hypothetical protein PKX31_00045 [Chitinophagaceae bacterium]|nr:hypothetical protein [Chitinophagaceae bacterium]